MSKASRKRSVLMLLENNPYPLDTRIHREAVSLQQAGFPVSIICPRDTGQPWYSSEEGVSVFRFPAAKSGSGLLGYAWEYGYSLAAMFVLSLVVLLSKGFAVVHLCSPPDVLFPIPALYKLLGKRYVVEHRDISPELYAVRFGKSGFAYKLLLWSEKMALRFADHVITMNDSYKKIAIERGGVADEAITIVRSGPDLKRVRLVDADPELRKRASTLIGYVGIIGFQDGVDYLIRALHHLVHDLGYRDVYCVIMGKGDALESCKQIASELQVDNYLWFTGWLTSEPLVRYLSTVDICVVPDPSNEYNDRSTFNKIMEYMAVAKPIVAFDLPEHRVSAGESALYAEPNDTLDFARKIVELIDSEDKRKQMGGLGRQRIEAALAWSFQAEFLVQAYQTVTQTT